MGSHCGRGGVRGGLGRRRSRRRRRRRLRRRLRRVPRERVTGEGRRPEVGGGGKVKGQRANWERDAARTGRGRTAGTAGRGSGPSRGGVRVFGLWGVGGWCGWVGGVVVATKAAVTRASTGVAPPPVGFGRRRARLASSVIATASSRGAPAFPRRRRSASARRASRGAATLLVVGTRDDGT